MARNLYRFYLYSIYIALLIFITVVTGQMLNIVLKLTPLRGPFTSTPDRQDIVQSVVLAVAAWAIAGALAGLHYWLIQRDIQHDVRAGASAIRSFFLNVTEALCMAVAIPVIGFTLASLGLSESADIVTAVAFAVPIFALAGCLEWQRRRTQVDSGAALVFQRLHFYGVQVILLLALSYAWFTQFRPLVDGLIFASRGTLEACHSGNFACPSYNMFYLAISLLWLITFWIGYGWLVRNDCSHILRFVWHGASLAYGVAWIVAGIYSGVKLILLPFFKLLASFKDILGLNPSYDFVSPLTLGILIVGIYHLWLRGASKQGLISLSTNFWIENTIATIVCAIAFWIGCGAVLYNILQKLSPAPTVPDALSWLSAIALVVAGLGYIPLEIYQRRWNTRDSSLASSRRGLVFTLLGGGILAAVIGGVTALYHWLTALLGSPLDNGQQQVGLASLIVGIVLVAIYLWSALKEGYWKRTDKQSVPSADALTSSAPLPDAQSSSDTSIADVASLVLSQSLTQSATIEETLDELLAGKIARDEAVARIRVLLKSS